jgi:hypothetical protein
VVDADGRQVLADPVHHPGAPPKGQLPEDWEDREQTLFRATAFGDDIDRPLLKSGLTSSAARPSETAFTAACMRLT